MDEDLGIDCKYTAYIWQPETKFFNSESIEVLFIVPMEDSGLLMCILR